MLHFNSITKMNFFSSLLIIFLLTGSLTYYLLKTKYDDFLINSKMQEMKSLEYQKQLLQNEVERAISLFRYKRSLVEKKVGQDLKRKVDEVVTLAENIYRKNRNTRDPDDIRSMVRESIRPMRNNNGEGYFFAVSLEGREELYPIRPELEGKILLDLQDRRGAFAILDEIKIAKEKGAGFVEHYWPKPGQPQDKTFLKISYIRLFKQFNWYFGTGSYLDDIEKEMQQEAFDYLRNIRISKKAEDGLLVMELATGQSTNFPARIHFLPDSIPKQLDSLEAFAPDYFGQDYCKALDNQLKIYGRAFTKFYTKANTEDTLKTRIIYLQKFPEWNWLVGAVMDVSDLYHSLDLSKKAMKEKLVEELIYIIVITLIFFLLAALFSWYVSLLIRKEFVVFTDFFSHAAVDNRMLSITSLDIREFKALAESLNLMIYKKENIEKRLKESENTFRSFMDHADEFMIIKDLDYRYVIVNKKFKEVLVLEYSQIIGKTPQELGYSGEEIEEMLEVEQQVITCKHSIIREKRAMKSQPFGVEWLEEIVFPIFDTDGALKFIGILSRDITARKKAEENIAQQQEELQKAYRELQQSQEIVIRQEKLASLGTMIAGIAHEINNPAQAIEFSLTGLQLNVDDLEEIITELRKVFLQQDQQKLQGLQYLEQLLSDRQIDVVFKEVTTVVKDNKNAVLRISSIIQSIKRLVYNNIELTDCSINEIIHDSINLVKNQIKNTISIETDLQKEMPLFRGSAQEMGQVFINMLLNAGDAVQEKQLKKADAFVRINSVYLESENLLKISVKDNGCGIKAEVIDKIFDPFLTTKPVGKGTGLGLYISYQIVENHGGRITVKSSPEEGTEFTIYLPVKTSAVLPDAP